jgi:hypothetical protein
LLSDPFCSTAPLFFDFWLQFIGSIDHNYKLDFCKALEKNLVLQRQSMITFALSVNLVKIESFILGTVEKQ